MRRAVPSFRKRIDMSTTTLMHAPLLQEVESVTLPETDGVPLETPWHRKNINLLCSSLQQHWRHRRDYFVGGNICVYYSLEQARNRDFLGPDVFVVQGVDLHQPRRVWATWLEGNRGPDVAIELLSDSTADYDLTDKKDLYEQTLRTPEYFCYDPDTHELRGWRLDARRRYQQIEPAANGRLWSEELQLWLGSWDGEYDSLTSTWLRWFNNDGEVCMYDAEVSAARADIEARRANAEAERANAEMDRANAEAERAEAESERAARAEAELGRLKQLLAAQGVATDR